MGVAAGKMLCEKMVRKLKLGTLGHTLEVILTGECSKFLFPNFKGHMKPKQHVAMPAGKDGMLMCPLCLSRDIKRNNNVLSALKFE